MKRFKESKGIALIYLIIILIVVALVSGIIISISMKDKNAPAWEQSARSSKVSGDAIKKAYWTSETYRRNENFLLSESGELYTINNEGDFEKNLEDLVDINIGSNYLTKNGVYHDYIGRKDFENVKKLSNNIDVVITKNDEAILLKKFLDTKILKEYNEGEVIEKNVKDIFIGKEAISIIKNDNTLWVKKINGNFEKKFDDVVLQWGINNPDYNIGIYVLLNDGNVYDYSLDKNNVENKFLRKESVIKKGTELEHYKRGDGSWYIEKGDSHIVDGLDDLKLEFKDKIQDIVYDKYETLGNYDLHTLVAISEKNEIIIYQYKEEDYGRVYKELTEVERFNNTVSEFTKNIDKLKKYGIESLSYEINKDAEADNVKTKTNSKITMPKEFVKADKINEGYEYQYWRKQADWDSLENKEFKLFDYYTFPLRWEELENSIEYIKIDSKEYKKDEIKDLMIDAGTNIYVQTNVKKEDANQYFNKHTFTLRAPSNMGFSKTFSELIKSGKYNISLNTEELRFDEKDYIWATQFEKNGLTGEKVEIETINSMVSRLNNVIKKMGKPDYILICKDTLTRYHLVYLYDNYVLFISLDEGYEEEYGYSTKVTPSGEDCVTDPSAFIRWFEGMADKESERTIALISSKHFKEFSEGTLLEIND